MAGKPISAITFIGIGNMGWPMAENLVRAGFAVTAVDRDARRAADFAMQAGGRVVAHLAESVAGADAVITMLPSSDDVSEAVDAVAEAMPTGCLLIEMSSGVPAITRKIASRLAGLGVATIDCPVSGGVERARTGELTIMAGGSPADLDRADPVLSPLGRAVHRCGPLGTGQAMKSLNNLVSACGLLISIEALIIGQESGLDPDRMIDILNVSTGMNNSTQNKLRQFVLSRTFDSGFRLDLMAKDLEIALGLAHEGKVATPLAALSGELWRAASRYLGAGHDHTEIALLAEILSGVALSHGSAAIS